MTPTIGCLLRGESRFHPAWTLPLSDRPNTHLGRENGEENWLDLLQNVPNSPATLSAWRFLTQDECWVHRFETETQRQLKSTPHTHQMKTKVESCQENYVEK